MDEKFTQEEKTAVASVLYNLAKADFKTQQGESECLKTCLSELDIDAKGIEMIPQNELQMKAYETLRHLSKEKKLVFSRMMTQMARADGHFGPRERDFVKEILVMCDVPFVHR